MATSRQMVVLMIALTIGATLLGPFATIIGGATGVQTVTNESVTASPGTYQPLDGYKLVSGSETVYWFNSTSSSYETLPGGDYTLNETAGSIQLNDPPVSANDDVLVTYDYNATTGSTTTIAGLLVLFAALLLLVYIADPIQSMT